MMLNMPSIALLLWAVTGGAEGLIVANTAELLGTRRYHYLGSSVFESEFMRLPSPEQQRSIRLRARMRRIFAAFVLLWVIAMIVMNNSRAYDFIATRFAENILFVLRDKLGRTPPVTDKLKILAVDDSTFALLGSPTPKFHQWVQLFENLAKQKPQAILVDFLFSTQPDDTPETRKALETMRRLNIPVYVGAYLVPQVIPYRHELTLDNRRYHVSRYMTEENAAMTEAPTFTKKWGYHAYGHHETYDHLFTVGHIVYNDVRRLQLFTQIGPDRLLPHLSTYAAKNVQFSGGKVWLNDIPVPMDKAGNTYFNHRPPQSFYERAKSLRFALGRAEQGLPEKSVQEGDVVVILTSFSTGNTDIVDDAPFGPIPGGFNIAAVVDSVMTGRWIKLVEWDNALLLAALGGAAVLAIWASTLWFWSAVFLIPAAYFAVSVYLFAWHDLIVPWAIPLMGFAGMALILFAYRSILNEIERLALQKDFYVEKARRLEEEKKKIILEQSLALGKVVQDLLLPKKPSYEFGDYRFETQYHPARVMGGDWIYVWETNNDERRVFVGDVMGKGPSAAIPVAIIIGTLRECENQSLSVTESIQKLNQRFMDLFEGKITATLNCIVLSEGMHIDFYNAGSPGWFCLSQQQAAIVPLRSNPIGLNRDFTPAHHSLTGQPGMTLFTFTDGYLEGSRAVKRLINALNGNVPSDSRTIHTILMKSGEGARLEDDRTLLAVKVAS